MRKSYLNEKKARSPSSRSLCVWQDDETEPYKILNAVLFICCRCIHLVKDLQKKGTLNNLSFHHSRMIYESSCFYLRRVVTYFYYYYCHINYLSPFGVQSQQHLHKSRFYGEICRMESICSKKLCIPPRASVCHIFSFFHLTSIIRQQAIRSSDLIFYLFLTLL